MRIKKYFIIILLCFFAFVIDVNADSCTDCAAKGTPCGMCGYSCTNVDGVCKTKVVDACTECAAKGTPCGMCGYGCTNVDGVCKTNTQNSEGSTSNPKDDTQYGSTGNGDKYNNYSPNTVSCGNGLMTDIPKIVPNLTSKAYTLIQIAVPIVLVLFASIDLVKSLYAQKEDEIKKSTQTLFKRLIAAAIIFFVFVIVKLLISVVADGNSAKILKCTECFIENKCD